MNILFFSSNSPYSEFIPYKKQIGGAEINLRLIAEEFAKLNHNVYYCTTKFGKLQKKKINNVEVYFIPIFYIPFVDRYISLFKKINNVIITNQYEKNIRKIITEKKIDIIHTYSTYPDTYISIIAAKKYKTSIIQRIGGRVWFNLLQNNAYLRKRIEWTFNNVDMLLFNSEYIKEKTYDYFNRMGFIVKTPYNILDIGINFNQLKKININNIIYKYNLSKNDKILLCVESFKYYSKRQDLLIRALPIILDKISNLKLIFIGEGDTLDQMKNLAKELNVNKNILFLGGIPHQDVLSIMKISDIVVHPTEFEAHSTVLKESFALGKPFLTSDIESMKDILKTINIALLTKNDPLEFAKKIILLLENKELCNIIGKSSEIYARKYFNSEKNISKYEKLFLDICNYKKE